MLSMGQSLKDKKGKKVISQQSTNLPTGKKLLEKVVTSLEDDKAKDIVVIDLIGKSDMADYLVIASGTSQRQVAAIAGHLRDNLKKVGQENVAVEGMDSSDWVLVDSGDIIVHVFHPEVREFYNLEKMWGSGGKVEKINASNNS